MFSLVYSKVDTSQVDEKVELDQGTDSGEAADMRDGQSQVA